MLKNSPIQKKLMAVILLTSGAVLALTCSVYFVYEYITFRQTLVTQLSTLGEIVATNSTAALAFENSEDASEILSALKAEKHIVAAGLYDEKGNLFSVYPADLAHSNFPAGPGTAGYQFEQSYLIGFQPILQGSTILGTLYLKSDMGAMYDRFLLYGGTALFVVILSFLVAYGLSKILQKRISQPILDLAETAKAISQQHDYSVRAIKVGNDELGLLTDAFNQMLTQIETQNQEIISFNQKLEHKVIERTSEMEIANKELEAFSYSVSHDLRAPLRSIHGYMNIFQEDYYSKIDDEGKKLVDIVIRNAQRMGQLIDDLLAFSRMGRKELTKSNLDMEEIVNTVVQELTEHEKDRKMNIRALPLSPAVADPSMVRQVWINLISNSIKYTRKKEQAEIEIGCYDHEGKTFYYIKDNGAGFDMTYVNKLFGVFQRLHKTNDFEGTGVGLALVRRIVQRHGGSIWAEGKINEGAKFYFVLNNNKPTES